MEEQQPVRFTDLLEQAKLYWKEVWRKKMYIIITAILVSGLMVLQAWLTPKKYNAPLTFVINEDDGGGGLGVSAILGELGLGGGKGGHNYEKIKSLSTSRLILSKCLKKEVDFKGKSDLLGNHILDNLDVTVTDKDNSNSEESIGFRFKNEKSNEYLAQEEKAFVKLVKYLKGDPEKGIEGIVEMKYNDESTFMQINAKCTEPDLSIIIANTVYDELSEFYIHNTIEKQQATYEHVQRKSDSLYGEIRSSELQLAKFQDQARGIILNTNKLPRQQLLRKIEMLYVMYGEAAKNRETAEFLLKNSTPYFQVIDRPIGPFQPLGKSRFKALIIGGILGTILSIGFIVGRLWFFNKLKEEQQAGV